jgi:hypothetical protein
MRVFLSKGSTCFLFCTLLVVQQKVYAQKEGFNGVFGSGVAINFNTIPPTIFIPPRNGLPLN